MALAYPAKGAAEIPPFARHTSSIATVLPTISSALNQTSDRAVDHRRQNNAFIRPSDENASAVPTRAEKACAWCEAPDCYPCKSLP
jgi:hypothetical protein